MLKRIKHYIQKEKFVFDKINILDLFLPDYLDRKALYDYYKNEVNKYISGKVLDLGCGSKPYEEILECDEYIGIDTENSGHWENGILKGPDILYDGRILPFDDEEFDIVFSSQVFEHIEDIDLSFLEINRVLKRGGMLIITMPMAEEEHEIPFDFRRYTEYGVRKEFEKYEFKVIQSGKINNYRRSLAILKIGMICNTRVVSIIKYLEIFFINVVESIMGNKPDETAKFSNKIYCVGKKYDRKKI